MINWRLCTIKWYNSCCGNSGPVAGRRIVAGNSTGLFQQGKIFCVSQFIFFIP
jgi:hypothetical protein